MEALWLTWFVLVTIKFVKPKWQIAILVSTTILSSVYGEEIKFGQTAETLNTASGFIAIESDSSNIELPYSDIKTFRTMIRNLVSVGLVLEPNEISMKLLQADDDNIKKMLSQGGFKLNIKPNCKDGKYQLPTRKITENEGRKLKRFLEKMNTSGFEIKIVPV